MSRKLTKEIHRVEKLPKSIYRVGIAAGLRESLTGETASPPAHYIARSIRTWMAGRMIGHLRAQEIKESPND